MNREQAGSGVNKCGFGCRSLKPNVRPLQCVATVIAQQ